LSGPGGRRAPAPPCAPLRALAPLSLLLLAAGCLHARTAGPAPAGVEEGLASYYADGLQGHPTASGRPYDRAALTCAHRTAPFGARLRVTAVETGRSVVVTVNDRGPHVAGRVVDLSRAAAERLGMVASGLVRVRVERADLAAR
jgi:rare lipoprotein A